MLIYATYLGQFNKDYKVEKVKWSTPQPRMETVQTQQNLGSKDGDNFLIVNYVAKMEATCKKLEAVPHPKLPSFNH